MTRNSLKTILKNIYTALSSNKYNNASKAHLEFAAEKIGTILDAQIQIN
jgi:ribosomal protein S20